MNTRTLVEWQRRSPETGLVECWWTHPFLDEMNTWDLKDKTWLEFGAGLGTASLRQKCKWVDSIEANRDWAQTVSEYCGENHLHNGKIYLNHLADGVQENIEPYFALIPKEKYDIISVDGIFRNECLQWAIDHFKGRGGILIADNWKQSFVWMSEAAERLMEPYPICVFEQTDHTNNDGVNKWKTVYWEIPA